MDSWNARYPNQKLYCDSANDYGYYVRGSSGSAYTAIGINQNKNNGGELFFANNCSLLTDGDDKVTGYWLASTNANNEDLVISVFSEEYKGNVNRIYEHPQLLQQLRRGTPCSLSRIWNHSKCRGCRVRLKI